MHPNLILGQAGEDAAASWYTEAGYTILERNWRCAQGEIDLLCTRDRTLVVCEVKTRRSDRQGAPEEAVTRTKQLRLRRLAVAYLRTYGGHYDEVRFDVASVLGTRLSVIEDAF
ncbi:MAG TPA: YraN family protein [Acidimicrobiales bacterium]|jgi:putative endonuclease|nr:YraN family protein [Acidimicrobiales bacterium]